MEPVLESIRSWVDVLLPERSPRRKVVQIISVVLLFEGLSVVALFSYFGLAIGLASIAIGLPLMILLHRPTEQPSDLSSPIGLRILPRLCSILGGEYMVMSLGASMIILVVVFNTFSSSRPDYGDVDTITILLGAMIMAYPLSVRVAPVEISFAVWFVALVFVFLAAPQAVTALTGGPDSSGVSSWYVEYMLAVPFAESLNLLGVEAYTVGNTVTMQLQDGTIHSLTISTYCAGLYSFSIFLSAFISFVLVFEKLPLRTLSIVVALGVAAAYLGNILRMMLIGIIGYYEGIDALLWAHKNVGWMVFLAWSSVFWYLIFRYTVRGSGPKGLSSSDGAAD